MIYLALSIICSVTVGVLLKLAKRYQIDILQAITWNYLFAIFLSAVFFKPKISHFSFDKNYPIYFALGILLPTVFIFLGKSIKKAGLARTDISQRLSLFISLCGAYFLFNESFDRYKEVGLVFGLVAIILIMYRKTTSATKDSWLYLLLVFIGFGAIDLLFKLVSQIITIPYTTSLSIIFSIAFILSLAYLLYLVSIKKVKLQPINFVCGGILGFFNFGNILFYLKAHQYLKNDPSIVFASMNLGVIILGSMIGVVIFKERLSKFNYTGLVLAILAITLITLSKIYAV
jgi:drug/metabolite transporter (DMT)-like permease